MTQEHCIIHTDKDTGHVHAMGPSLSMTVIPKDDCHAAAFNRNAIKKHFKTGETEHIRWLVGELDDVKVYVNGGSIIITKDEMLP